MSTPKKRNFHQEVTQKEIRALARKLGRLLRKQPYHKQYDGYLLVLSVDMNHYKLLGTTKGVYQ